MIEAVRRALIDAGIHVIGEDEPIFFNWSWRARRPIRFETPVQLRAGQYDVDQIGAFTYLGGGHSVFRGISTIGRFCSIAGNINAGAVEHPTYQVTTNSLIHGAFNEAWHEAKEFCRRNSAAVAESRKEWLDDARRRFGSIKIGNDVWIGEGALIRRGVTIGDGAIVAARSVVTKSVDPYTIVAGSPARTARLRFPETIVERLIATQWWDYGLSILEGAPLGRVEATLEAMEENIANGTAVPFRPGYVEVDSTGAVAKHPAKASSVRH